MSKNVVCRNCGNEYSNIGAHWTKSGCPRPTFSDVQKQIITGVMMGDANVKVQSNNGNNFLRMEMITPTYLYYLDSGFGSLSTGVSFARDGDERSDDPSNLGNNYSDTYILRTRSHPYFNHIREKWYPDGKKVFPNDIELTPTVLKHWYCNDGSLDNSGSSPTISIAMINEMDNTDKITEIFKGSNVVIPDNYQINNNGNNISCNATFGVTKSHKLFEYMGNPLPAFEYKWPEQYR